jgi:diguanylate cyclase (GGDEF)-like protein
MSVFKKSIFFDLIVIAIMTAILVFVSVKFDLFERFYHFTREHQSMQLGELLPLSFVLLICTLYFVLRRWRESVKYSHTVEENASRDSLTKLLNRRTLERALGAEWDRFLRYNEDFCIVLFDIDDFNEINKNLGNLEGDRILIEVSKMLQINTRKTDFSARWGEEEFLILCPVCKSEQAVMLAEKLRAALYRNLKDGIELSASFAVAQSNNTDSLESLIKRADLALYKAKQRGKNCVVSG